METTWNKYPQHNQVAFLKQGNEWSDFSQIIDFLQESPIYYALTLKPEVYGYGLKQFWDNAIFRTVEDEP